VKKWEPWARELLEGLPIAARASSSLRISDACSQFCSSVSQNETTGFDFAAWWTAAVLKASRSADVIQAVRNDLLLRLVFDTAAVQKLSAYFRVEQNI
jgi:hypothetical protein